MQVSSFDAPPALAAHVRGANERQFGAGSSARMPLVRAMRMRQPDMSRVVTLWLDRFHKDAAAGIHEAMVLILTVADVPAGAQNLQREDVQGRRAVDVIEQLTSVVAMQAAESGADFTQHWLTSKDAGSSRARDNFNAYWCSVATVAACEDLTAGMLATMWPWLQCLTESQFRSIRHVASVACLHLASGLCLRRQGLLEFCGTASLQVAQEGTNIHQLAVADQLGDASRDLQGLAANRDSICLALLRSRAKDVDPVIRLTCMKSFQQWMQTEPKAFMDPVWTAHLYNRCGDGFPEVRGAALATLAELLGALPSESEMSRALRSDLQEGARKHVLERCHDVNAQVGAQAVKCATLLAARGMLTESDFDPVIDLVWDGDAIRRSAACIFVSRNVFSEDVMDTSAKAVASVSLASSIVARRRVLMLLQFIAEYADGHYVLADRLAQALWRSASCLEDWEVLVSLALPGNEHSLSGEMHTILLFFMEAVARLALCEAPTGKADLDGYSRAVMVRSARALAPRLAPLLSVCQGEPLAMRRAVALSRHVLHFCVLHAQSDSGDSLMGSVGDGAPAALKAVFLRQPDPVVLESAAECFSSLLQLRSDTASMVVELAQALRDRFLQIAHVLLAATRSDEAPTAEVVLAVAVRLRILSKAVDVSMCNINQFVAVLLQLLDSREAAGKGAVVGSHLASVLFELLALLLARQAVAWYQPPKFVDIVALDEVNADELKMLPTAVRDFGQVALAALTTDANEHVRAAAFASSMLLLTAWWKAYAASQSTAKQPSEAKTLLTLAPEVLGALRECFGQLLLAANAVPSDKAAAAEAMTESTSLAVSSYSKFFAMLMRIVAKEDEGSDVVSIVVTDAEHVEFASLACKMVIGCQHPDVAGSPLVAIVLSQALSTRADLQDQAWMFMRELRAAAKGQDAHMEAFFVCLMTAVCSIHRDVGVEVARDLSSRLLQHVAVGKLARNLQQGYMRAVSLAIKEAFLQDAPAGLLEVIAPWVTKNIIDPEHIEKLGSLAQMEAKTASNSEQAAESAGLAVFLDACHATVARDPVHTEPARGDHGSLALLPMDLDEAYGGEFSTPRSTRPLSRVIRPIAAASSRKRQRKVARKC